MRMRLKFVAVVLTILAISGAAQAITVSEWAASPTQQVGDKIFTFVSSTLSSNVTVSFNLFDIGGQTLVSMTLGNLTVAPLNGQVLNYTLAIDQGMSPGDYFGTVSIDTTRVYGNTTVTKTIYEPIPDIVVSGINGNPSGTVTIPGNLKYLTIRDVFTGGGYLSTATNYFTEVPEPATICLLGFGGLALLRKRKA